MSDAPKPEKFIFATDFFDVAMMDGLATPAVAAPRLPRSLQEARDEGLKEGLAQGRAEGEAILQQELTALRQQVANLTQQLSTQYVQWELSLTNMALSLVRVTLHKLLGHAAAHYSDQVLEQHLRGLLNLLTQGEPLTLRVHPQARGYHEKLALPQASIGQLAFRIVPDDKLGPTDVVIEWPGGGLESKLADHMAALDALLAQAGADTSVPTPPLPASSTLQAPPEPSPLEAAAASTKSRAAELLGDDELVDALK
jgi:flagellar biosynthesis/type III secretory pathway protein FliH